MAKRPVSNAQNIPQTSPDEAARQWLYRPAVDLIIGCGAWSGPLLALAYWLGASHTVGMSVAFYALALLFNYPHYMATIYRAYHTREDFTRYRIFTIHLTALVALTMALAHWFPRMLPWVFTLYLTWSPWHYTGQNFGLLMMFARRSGARPAQTERNALYMAFLASYLLLFLGFHTGHSADRLVLSLNLPETFTQGARAILLLVFAGTGGWALFRLIRQAGWRRMAPVAVLFSTQVLWFVLPAVLELGHLAQLPQTRYSTGVLAVMHSAQYLWVTSFYARREAQGCTGAAWGYGPYFLALIVGGIALFVPGPWLISWALHYDYAASFLIFTALINIHHFVLDGAIWKLRDGRIAALLVGARDGAVESAGHASVKLDRLIQWTSRLAGPEPAARLLRIAFTLILLVVAGLDQIRFYSGVNDGDPQNLARAAALSPYDAIVQARLANAYGRAGETERKIAALRRAVGINPYYFEPQNALAETLLQDGRYREAYEHYKQMFAHVAPDANALVNYGLLAARFGDEAEAVESWRRAAELDPTRATAHLYLAEVYYRRQNFAAAIPHYEQYLSLAAQARDSGPRAPETVLTATLRLAGAYARADNPDRALAFYESVIALAGKTGEKTCESLALASAGQIYAARGQRDRAAACYQRALAIDATSGDARAEAVDWFNYGQFLRRNGAPARLALACFLKAESLLKEKTGIEAETVAAVRQEVEASLGTETAEVRKNLQALAAEALALRL
jgi:tetratricopeptide (TPR) repeat protein